MILGGRTVAWHSFILWIWAFQLLASIPDWVMPIDASLEPVPIKESQSQSQYLLLDRQYNVQTRTYYEHVVLKVLNRFGAEKWDQYRLNYHPDQMLPAMHAVNVYRNGVWSDRLMSARQMKFNEGDRQWHNVFFGDHTTVYLFSDIQPGDILDIHCSYTQIGDAPHSLFTPFDVMMSWNISEEVERTFLRLIVPKEPALQYFTTADLPSPVVREFSDTSQEWIFDQEHTPAKIDEPNQPDWYEIDGMIVFSQWGNWRQYITARLSDYHLPSERPPQEIERLVYQWMIQFSDPKERALTALRFVQDEVHYLSYGGRIPEHPFHVFQMRQGDCKSKTHLLNYFLSLMNIQSCTVVVYNRGASFFPRLPPGDGFTNHVIARITLDGQDYFVDPCYTLQGGPLEDAYTRRLYFGLPIDPNAEGPVPIPLQTRRMEIDMLGCVNPSQELDMNVTVTYLGFEAEWVRTKLQTNKPKALEKEYMSILRGATQTTPLEIEDDRLNNRLIVKAAYHFSNILKLNIGDSWAISEYLDLEIDPKRQTPYKLNFPFEVKETIRITGLKDLTYPGNEMVRENDFCSYRLSQEFDGDALTIQREIRFLQDHVPVKEFESFNTFINEIQEQRDPHCS